MKDLRDLKDMTIPREPEPWEQPYSAPSGRTGKGRGRGAPGNVDFRRMATYGEQNDADQRAPRGMEQV